MVYGDNSGLKYSSNENRVDIIVTNFVQRDNSLIYRPRVFEYLDLNRSGNWDCCEALVPTSEPLAFLNYSYKFKTLIGQIFYAKCVAETIGLWCNSTSFLKYHHSVTNNPNAKKALCGKDFKPAHLSTIGRIGKDRAQFAL